MFIRSSVSQGKSQEKKNSKYLEAAGKGELETLVTLLDAGADINCKDEKGDSALHLAAGKGHDTIVKTLVDHGLDVNSRARFNMTPLMYAANEGHESTAYTLIKAGADITCKDYIGYNALHFAAEGGLDTIVKMLVDQGLDVNTQGGQYGRTPLMQAAMMGNMNTFNILMSAGADITCKDVNGYDALYLASLGSRKIQCNVM